MSRKKKKRKQKPKKQFIGGKKITREEAFQGLGDPKDWDAFSKKVKEEFTSKPKNYPPGVRYWPKGSREERGSRVIGPKPGQPVGGGKNNPSQLKITLGKKISKTK